MTGKARNWTLAINLVFFGWVVAYLTISAKPTWLFIDLASEAPGVAWIFVKPATVAEIAVSHDYPVREGTSRLAFRVSALEDVGDLLFEPGDANRYEVLRLRWHSGFVDREASLEDIRASSGSIKLDGNKLVAQTNGSTIQLTIPRLSTVTLQLAALSVYGPATLLFGLLTWLAYRRRIGPIGLATTYVAAIALVYSYFCLHMGAQLPVYDDWRYVLPGPLSLINGQWNWLLATGNDTYFLTGQIIDYVCLALFNVDFMPIRWVALGLLMLNVWWVRRTVIIIGDGERKVVAIAIMLCAWSFVGGRLWGGTAMAYHQALPTLFSSLMLLYLIGPAGNLRQRYRYAILLAAAVASGLAYISGGMMVIAMALSAMFVGFAGRDGEGFRALRNSGVCLLIAGVALMAFQLSMVGHYQGSLVEHNHAAASVYPNDQRFWLSVIAQFGMAMGYSGTSLSLNAALAFTALLPGLAIAVRVILRWRDGQMIERPGLILAVLYATVAASIYAGVVAFGRAGFIEAGEAAIDVIAVAKARLHSWPISALLPFFFLGWVEATRNWDRRRLVPVSMAIAFLVPKSTWPLDMVRNLDPLAAKSINGGYCIAEKLSNNANSVICPDASGNNADLASGLQNMKSMDAKLIRDIRLFKPPLGKVAE